MKWYDVDVWNHTPTQTNECPLSRFSQHATPSLNHFHPFGCPVYILNRSLADGNSIPRWQPRSHLGIYLGRSPNHAKDVSLVLDLNTNHISANYHIIYEDKFQTIQHSNKNNEIWTKLFIRQLQTTLTSSLETSIEPKILRNHLSKLSSNTTHPTINEPINTSALRSGRLSRPPLRLAYFPNMIHLLLHHSTSSLLHFKINFPKSNLQQFKH